MTELSGIIRPVSHVIQNPCFSIKSVCASSLSFTCSLKITLQSVYFYWISTLQHHVGAPSSSTGIVRVFRACTVHSLSFIDLQTFGLFPLWAITGNGCCEHLCTRFCVGVCTISAPWVKSRLSGLCGTYSQHPEETPSWFSKAAPPPSFLPAV